MDMQDLRVDEDELYPYYSLSKTATEDVDTKLLYQIAELFFYQQDVLEAMHEAKRGRGSEERVKIALKELKDFYRTMQIEWLNSYLDENTPMGTYFGMDDYERGKLDGAMDMLNDLRLKK